MTDATAYLGLFIDESRENLESLNRILLGMESEGFDEAAGNEAYRLVHTLKGNARVLGVEPIGELAHTLEDVLEALRKEPERLVGGVITILLEALDRLESMLGELQASGSVKAQDEATLNRLRAFVRDHTVEEHGSDPGPVPSRDPALKPLDAAGASTHARASAGPSPLPSSETIRVKSRFLDDLLDLVGEIMISEIRINQVAAEREDRNLTQCLKGRAPLMSELQDTVLRMRMVPTDQIFRRFPRMVRDMARLEGKEVQLTIVGSDIEIDRGLVDDVGDCLVHLLRNAIDHGIESPEERSRGGKNPVGTVTLAAVQEQGGVTISVEDDGRGMDAEALARKAVALGLLRAEDAKDLDRNAALSLAFRPGVTTATRVTDVSGRGVGLDAVRSRIETRGGTVRLESEVGRGTRMTLHLPPSMSIIGAMLVEVNGEVYGIPLSYVRETLRVPRNEVHEVAKARLFRLREEVLPLLNLPSDFGGAPDLAEPVSVVVVQRNEERAGLAVTKLMGRQEIVVKSLGKDIGRTRLFSGATILGDGTVAMILDVGALL